MTFTITANVETREELISLVDAIVAATPDDEQREAELFNALHECADRLLKKVDVEEMGRVYSLLSVPLSQRRAGSGG